MDRVAQKLNRYSVGGIRFPEIVRAERAVYIHAWMLGRARRMKGFLRGPLGRIPDYPIDVTINVTMTIDGAARCKLLNAGILRLPAVDVCLDAHRAGLGLRHFGAGRCYR